VGRRMIWFYQREGQHLYYEVRLRQDGPGFELGISYPGGALLTETFDTEDALAARFAELQASLQRAGWGPLERREPSVSRGQRGAARRPLIC
jgi:hypothetical protein